MGCPTISTREMIRCLQYRPARAIMDATREFMVRPISHLFFSGTDVSDDDHRRERKMSI